MNFRIDLKDVESLERGLHVMQRSSIPFAMMQTLNDAAFQTMRESKKYIGRNMIERNSWTRRSIGVLRASTSHLESVIGSRAAYMEDQQLGGVKRSTKRHGVVLTTREASGEGEGRAPRRRLATPRNRVKAIGLTKRKGKNRKQRNAIAISMAARGTGSRYVFLDLGRKKGIFRVYGRRKKVSDVRMVHDLSRKSVVIPKEPWLTKSYEKVLPTMPRTYRRNLLRQLRRLTR